MSITPQPFWSGAAGPAIALRYLTGSMKLLHIGDSITYWDAIGFMKSLRPRKLVGLCGGLTTGHSNNDWGMRLGLQGIAGGGWTSPIPSGAASPTTAVWTEVNGTFPNTDYADMMIVQSRLETPTWWTDRLHGADFIWEALGRSVQPTVDYLAQATSNGSTNRYKLMLLGASNTLALDGPFIQCSGSGQWVKTSMQLPLGMDQSGWTIPGIRMPAGMTTVAGKQLILSIASHIYTGEAGLDYGNIAVAGTYLNTSPSTASWAATNGVYTDAHLSAIMAMQGTDTIMCTLGQNDAGADPSATSYLSFLTTMYTRLLSLNPNLQFILLSTPETQSTFGNSTFSKQATILRNFAAGRTDTLFLDVYSAFGPLSKNYANDGADTAFQTNYGLRDGVHKSDEGIGRGSEIVATMLEGVAYAGSIGVTLATLTTADGHTLSTYGGGAADTNAAAIKSQTDKIGTNAADSANAVAAQTSITAMGAVKPAHTPSVDPSGDVTINNPPVQRIVTIK